MTAIQGNQSPSRALEQSLSAVGAVAGNSAERAQEQPQQQNQRAEADTVEISSQSQGRGPETQGSEQPRAALESTQQTVPVESVQAASASSEPRPVQSTEAENEVPGRNVDRLA